MIENLELVLTAVVSGIGYSLVWYANKVVDPTTTIKLKDIDLYPILATAITGGAVGAYVVFTGGDLTQASLEVQMLSYAAMTALIERVLKTAARVAKPKLLAWGIIDESV